MAAGAISRGWRAAVLLAVLIAACGGGAGGSAGGEGGEKAAPAAGDGFETSWLGHLSKTYEGDLAQCAEATKAALRKLDLEVVESGGGIFQQTVDAEAKDGTSVLVQLKEVGKTTTRVAVKVGYLLGDRDAARRIHSEIGEELAGRRGEAEERKRRWRSGAGMPTTPTTVPTGR